MSASTIKIEAIEGKKRLKTFIELQRPIFAGDPNWVQPLALERMDLFSPGKNPYFKHAEAQYFIAWKNGEPVGRISAQVDQLVQSQIRQGLGHFGCFDCVDDDDVAGALFAAAEDWLRAKGMTAAQGPWSLNANSECGLLVDGFDTPPYLMMPHARRWYERLVEAQGYSKAKDLYAYQLDITRPFNDRVMRIVRGAERNKHIHVRPLDKKNYMQEIRLVFDIFNDAWSGNWGFVPLTDEEIEHTAKSMKPLVVPHRSCICELDGEPVAFMTAVADVNALIKDLNGSLLPFGWAKLAKRMFMDYPKRLRVPLMGVRKSAQSSPVGAAMAFLLIEYIRAESVARGSEHAELSWILEDNIGMRNILVKIGCEIYKTYRIYEKPLV